MWVWAIARFIAPGGQADDAVVVDHAEGLAVAKGDGDVLIERLSLVL